MNYLVARKLSNPFEGIRHEINQADVDLFMRHRENLQEYLTHEILYDQLIEAYWDYKNKVDYWCMRSISINSFNNNLHLEIRSSLNRLAFNVLNLGKFYLDRHYFDNGKKCFARDITGLESDKHKIIEQRKKLYQENKEYMIGCELRNGAQHNNFVVENITTQHKYNRNAKEAEFNFSVTYTRNELMSYFRNKEKIKLTEDKYRLTKILDGYIYAIAQMHKLNRDLTNNTIMESKSFITTIEERCISQENACKCYFEIEKEDHSTIDTSIEWFSVVDYLQEKHSHPINYSEISFNSL